MSNTNIAHRAPLSPPRPPRASIRRIPLRRDAAANYIQDVHGQQVAAKTLARLASVGGGPAFHKAGKYPLYFIRDLDEWARARLSRKVVRAKALVKRQPTPPRPRSIEARETRR